MTIQSQLNKEALNEVYLLEPDLKKFIDSQDAHHKNQIIYKLIQNGSRNIIQAYNCDCVKGATETEEFLRSLDYTFKRSEGYLSYSQFHAKTCDEEYFEDENLGYIYTAK